jgi:dihydrofolate synthase/folylpolyglutamate synthase
MNYNEALNFIINKQSLGILPGLDRILSLLDSMGNPQNKLKIIHVAGTNGKGTIANSIANALTLSGFKTGLFTSPWVCDYREQIQINGNMISKNDFAKYVSAYCEDDCSEFELVTAIMYKYFLDNNVDWAVVECGMGGLEDATNACDSCEIAVLTSIAVDHTAFLGDTIEKIAQQKAGIIKPNCKCVLYPNPKVENIVSDKCNSVGATLIKVPSGDNFKQNNINTVNAVLQELNLPPILSTAKIHARQERRGGVLVDGGHNIDAANALAPMINDEIAIIGMMRDKDVEGYLSIIAPKCKKIITTTPNNPRSMPCDELQQIAKKYCSNVVAVDNPLSAVEQEHTLVCGSFYLARDLRKKLFQT